MPGLHPLIRIVTLLVFAALVPWLSLAAVLGAGGLMLAATAWHPAMRSAAIRGLLRLRWLLLSIFVLYLWFVPGEPLLASFGAWSPTQVGVSLAMHRGAILAVMVWAAAAMLAVTEPREITASLRQLFAGPLRSPVTMRFADRVGLLLAEFPRVRDRVTDSLRHGEGGFSARAARLVEAVEAQASEPLSPQPPLPLAPVPPVQWLLPFSVLCGGITLIIL